jgi:hypothetical protein
VGISLTVTPRINEKKFVVMEIVQTIDNVSGVQTINETDWPIVTTRKMEADIAVRTGDTIVLGGLVLNSKSDNKSKIPLLGDIPILGRLFGSVRNETQRREVIVFITPYVMDTPEEIASDALRRKRALKVPGMWKRGWSDSDYAEPERPRRGERDPDGAALERGRRGAAGAFVDMPAPERAAGADPDAAAPLAGLDPETRTFIRQQDAKWSRSLENVDRQIEAEIRRQ